MEKNDLKEKYVVVGNDVSWKNVFKHYWPDITDEEINYILWNETCYPFSTEKTLEDIFQIYATKSLRK